MLDSLLPLGTQLHFVLLSSSASAPLLVQDDIASGTTTAVTTPAAQSTPYDGLHSLVHWGVAPWFDSYVSSKQSLLEGPTNAKKGNEAQMGKSPLQTYLTAGIPVTKKRFAELELSLLHLKQNVEIPEARLSVHPAVRKAVAQVSHPMLLR
jgi:dynein heavy chain 1